MRAIADVASEQKRGPKQEAAAMTLWYLLLPKNFRSKK
jgi:hypothetical protein